MLEKRRTWMIAANLIFLILAIFTVIHLMIAQQGKIQFLILSVLIIYALGFIALFKNVALAKLLLGLTYGIQIFAIRSPDFNFNLSIIPQLNWWLSFGSAFHIGINALAFFLLIFVLRGHGKVSKLQDS